MNQRDSEIVQALARGASLAEVAGTYGLSRERVRQIAAAASLPPLRLQQRERAWQAAEWLAEGRGGRTLSQAVKRFSVSRVKVKQALAEMDIDPAKLRTSWVLAKHAARLRGEGEAQCRRCGEVKPWLDMRFDTVIVDGQRVATRQHLCLDCNREVRREWEAQAAGRNPVPTVTHKVCTRCGIDKPAKEFHRHTALSTGLQSWCKQCQQGVRRR